MATKSGYHNIFQTMFLFLLINMFPGRCKLIPANKENTLQPFSCPEYLSKALETGKQNLPRKSICTEVAIQVPNEIKYSLQHVTRMVDHYTARMYLLPTTGYNSTVPSTVLVWFLWGSGSACFWSSRIRRY
jgi:hypothetical protein